MREPVSVSLQNALIRELEHTKKLIEESHHEKVRNQFANEANLSPYLMGILLFHASSLDDNNVHTFLSPTGAAPDPD